MNTSLILALTGLAAAAVPSRAGILAGPADNPANGHRYYLLAEASWQDSEADAVALGGHLATINDAAEQAWVFAAFGSHGGVSRSLWIGMRKVGDGDFLWVDGEPVGYTHWLPLQPDNALGDEAHVHLINSANEYGHPGGFWNDIHSPNVLFPTFNPICGVVEIVPAPAPALVIDAVSGTIHWDSVAGRRYQVQSNADLGDGGWIDVGLPRPGTGTTDGFAIPAITPGARRFYRVVLLP